MPSSLTTSPSPPTTPTENAAPNFHQPTAAPISASVCITNQRRPYRIADITATGVVRLGYF